MMFVSRSLAVAALCLGALTLMIPQADAGKNRYKGGAKYSSGGYSAGVRGHHRGYRRHAHKRGYHRHARKHGYHRYPHYRGYNRPIRKRGYSHHVYKRGYHYAYRGYYPGPYYGLSTYRLYYGVRPYYRNYPRMRVSYSRAHFIYCKKRYRSYRASDNSFQPYHGPRKACRSPYR